IDAWKHTCVKCPDVELGHFGDLRQRRARVEPVSTHNEDEVPVYTTEIWVLWVHDEHAHHAHRQLHHLVGMGVVHEGAAALKRKLVDEGLAGRDMRLRQAADAVHATWHNHAMPMDRGFLRELVGNEDPYLVALDGFDRGSRALAVIAPEICLHAGR